MTIRKEIILKNVDTGKLVMSEDGSYLAILTPEFEGGSSCNRRKEIKIYHCDSDEPTEFLDKIERKKHTCRYKEDQNNGNDLSFVKHMTFGNLNRKLIAYGDQKILILDIKKQDGPINKVDTDMFERILSLNYKSHRDRRD